MTGLTNEQVQERIAEGKVNVNENPNTRTYKQIILENTLTFFNFLNLVLLVLVLFVRSYKNSMFMGIILINTVIGIVQEIRAKKTIDKLAILTESKTVVLREGKKWSISTEKLVIDDLIFLKTGDQVPADVKVLEGAVEVNESLLTGESDNLTKNQGDELFSGSFVTSGEACCQVIHVGKDNYAAQITSEAKEFKRHNSELRNSLNAILKVISIIIVPLGAMLFYKQYFIVGDTLKDSVVNMVAAVLGMIPEGLYLLASVALAVSSIRLAQQKVLLHDMKCIETLARVDVLCVDKTGTITENTMKVQELIPTEQYDTEKMGSLRLMVGDFVSAMTNDNITMAAMKEYFTHSSGAKAISKTGFSSATKYSSATFEDKTYVLGAPEFVLLDDYEQHKEKITELASTGARVLVFGTYAAEIDGKALTEPVTPLGYILLANPIREAAKETFQYFAEQGVEVKVISGDNPVTVSKVAKTAGIENAENYVDASSLEKEEDIKKAILEKTVFGRVTPNQKRQFVQALKEAGKTVAMTGDGVNDVLALKDADCSIAMASGSDAAAQASQIVLLESDFSCMPQVVLEGRRVVNNIQRSASLFLVKNIFSFLLSLFSVVFMFTYPLEPSQVSLISMFTIGIPAFFLALEPNKNIIKGHFLTNVFLKALPAALTDALAVGALVVFGKTFGVGEQDISTAATMLLAIVGFMILYKISAPMNKLRAGILGGCIAGLLFCSIYLNQLFAITGMTTKCIMLFVVFAIATEPVLRYLTILLGKGRVYYRRLRGKAPLEEEA